MERPIEDWNVHLIDTGSLCNTGGRVLRLEEHLQRGDLSSPRTAMVCPMWMFKLWYDSTAEWVAR